MAPISELLDKYTDWYEESGLGDHLATLGRITSVVSWFLLAPIGLYIVLVYIFLFVRSMRITFGSRVAPDGRLAIIITGATSGFGLATAKRLYNLGFTVFACYYNDQELGYAQLLDLKLKPFPVKGKKAQLNFQPPSLFLIKMDVRSSDSIERSCQDISHLLNTHNMRLYCLLNNAGTSGDSAFELTTRDSIRNMIDTNLTGVIRVTREFILRIIKEKARVVNVSSGVYQFPGRNLCLYGATKSAVSYFSDSLNADLAPYGASCHTIVPGNLITQSNILYTRMKHFQTCIEQLNEEERETYKTTIHSTGRALDYIYKTKMEMSPHEDPKKVADIYKIQMPDLDALNAEQWKDLDDSKGRGFLFKLAHRFVSSSDGFSSRNLDESYCIQGFEDAIRLVNAPRRIYAGSRFYYHISGPMLQYTPPVVCELMGAAVSHNLVKRRQ